MPKITITISFSCGFIYVISLMFHSWRWSTYQVKRVVMFRNQILIKINLLVAFLTREVSGTKKEEPTYYSRELKHQKLDTRI